MCSSSATFSSVSTTESGFPKFRPDPSSHLASQLSQSDPEEQERGLPQNQNNLYGTGPRGGVFSEDRSEEEEEATLAERIGVGGLETGRGGGGRRPQSFFPAKLGCVYAPDLGRCTSPFVFTSRRLIDPGNTGMLPEISPGCIWFSHVGRDKRTRRLKDAWVGNSPFDHLDAASYAKR